MDILFDNNEMALRQVDLKFAHGENLWGQVNDHSVNLRPKGEEQLRRALGDSARSVVIESNYVCKDYRSLYSGFLSRKFQLRSPFCERLHFFKNKISDLSDLIDNYERASKNYLGYSVIQPTNSKHANGCLGATVLDLIKCEKVQKNIFLLRTRFASHIFGLDFEVNGFPFMQQNGESLVCAHAATWATCRYLSERYNDYGELYPYQIATAVGTDAGRLMPGRGMTYRDYSTILHSIGSHPIVLYFDAFGKQEDRKQMLLDMYCYIESGFPLLLSFKKHVMVAIGHTLNTEVISEEIDSTSTLSSCSIPGKTPPYSFEDTYKRKFIESFSFVNELVVVDDNTGPYALIGKDCVAKGSPNFAASAHQYCLNNAKSVVVPAPDKIFLLPNEARRLAYTYIFDPDVVSILNSVLHESATTDEPVVTRTFLTSSNRFKQFKLKAFLDGDEASGYPLRLSLPHFIWITEFSCRSKYSGGEILAEIVMDATAAFREKSLIYARIGKCVLQDGIDNEFKGATVSFRQYRHNLGDCDAQKEA